MSGERIQLHPIAETQDQFSTSNAIQLNKREKFTLFLMTLFSGLGSGTGVGLGTFSIIAGAGVATTVGMTALIWIILAGVASAIVAVPIMYMAFKDHLRANRKLVQDIDELTKRQHAAQQLVEKNMQEYFLAYLRLNLLYQEILQENKLTRDEELEIKNKIESYAFAEMLPALRVLTEMLEQNNATNATTLRKSLAPSYSSAFEFKSEFEKTILPALRDTYLKPVLESKPKKASLGGPIKSGVLTCLGVFSTVSGTAWGVASMVLGAVAVVTAPVSVLAFASLAVGLLVGVAVGAAVAYYKHRKSQREKQKSHLSRVNEQLDELAQQIDQEREHVNEHYRHLKTNLGATKTLRNTMTPKQIKIRKSGEFKVSDQAASLFHHEHEMKQPKNDKVFLQVPTQK